MAFLSLNTYFTAAHMTTHETLSIKIKMNRIQHILFFFKFSSNLLFTQLIDVSFIDYFDRKFRYELFYNILSIKYNRRVILSTFLEENTIPESIHKLYLNSN